MLRRLAVPPHRIRTSWLVVATVVVVSGVGLLAYRDAVASSEAGLVDLGVEQLAVARAVQLARSGGSLGGLEDRGAVVLTGTAQRLHTLDGRFTAPPELLAAVARHESVVRLERAVAPSLGLPARTAMVGIATGADGSVVAVARTAEHQRDRDRDGRTRSVMAIILVAVVVSAFAIIAWFKQRSESELARELAVAETASRRDAELERLSRAATMAALGSGVAHELSTPLGVIMGRAEQLLARSADERGAKAAQTIIEQTQYIDRVVRGLLGLARGAPIALEQVAPEAVVADTIELVEHRFQRKGVLLVPMLGDGHPAIRCEPLLLKHALVNLLLNACDASVAGQVVELELHSDSAQLELAVTDEGSGIAAADITRAVEPFFTTKPVGQGTGLGLAIANEIAKTHRGRLELVARQPCGTRASLTIPLEGSRP